VIGLKAVFKNEIRKHDGVTCDREEIFKNEDM